MLRSHDSAPGSGCRHPLKSFPSGYSARLLPDVLSPWCLLPYLSVCVSVHICNSVSVLMWCMSGYAVCTHLYVCERISLCVHVYESVSVCICVCLSV